MFYMGFFYILYGVSDILFLFLSIFYLQKEELKREDFKGSKVAFLIN